MSIDSFYKKYADKGFMFPDELLTRYALSLATKPFVILSGISGSGKTKIAQLFEVFDNPPSLHETREPATNNGQISLTLTEAFIGADSRANLKYADLSEILTEEEWQKVQKLIQEFRDRDDDGNVCPPIPFKIVDEEGAEHQVAVYLQRATKTPLVRLRSRSRKSDDEEYDSRPFFRQRYSVGDVLKLEYIGNHALKIVSVNDVAAIQQVAQDTADVVTKCFISVKSNWTDSTELFGYFNPMSEKYSMTKLLRFVLTAQDNPNRPFFLILDEMNLSKVEHYFSDFLSCLESRTASDDGGIVQEGITLFAGSEVVATDDDEYDEIPSTVALPLNLYVTGTVNVDDTTYMFSPKVLDRANVIEFNEILLGEEPETSIFKLTEFPDFSELSLSSMAEYDALDEAIKSKIKQILEILKKYNLHFGYRTISEISHFILNAEKYIGKSEGVSVAALDIQILQKVLPKLHGNYATLSDPLRTLIWHLSGSNGNLDDFDFTEISAIDISAEDYKRSLGKLITMYGKLSNQGFASFVI